MSTKCRKKSTLFNQPTGSKNAIIDHQPGVTRDRLFGVMKDEDRPHLALTIIDTGGL